VNSEQRSKVYAQAVFYPTLAWNILLGRVLRVRNWWDRIDPHVIVGAYPFASDVADLAKEGVRAVVNTCEEYAGPQAEYDGYGISQLRIPTTDFTHPKLSDVQRAVEFVQEHAQKGETVYIHCKAGRARSATIALCFLMKHREMTMDEAQRELLVHRPHINPRLTQRPVVREFFESMQQNVDENVEEKTDV
jgi:atypical dual specificity phosphatase